MSDQNVYAPPTANLEMANDETEGAVAARGDRLKAAIIDGLLVLVIDSPVIWYYTQKTMAAGNAGLALTDLIIMNLCGLAAVLLLNGYYWSRYGQSIGKRIIGIKIVDLSGNKPPLWRIVVLRHWLISLFSLLPIIGKLVSIGDVLFIFRGDRRCIHDHLAGTLVVRAAK